VPEVRRHPWLLAVVLPAACAAGSAPRRPVEAVSALYIRADSNATTIVSPHVRAAARATESVDVDAEYAVDAWTGASVDIVSAATGAVTETRHEVKAGLGHEAERVRIGGSYRFSLEPDYRSHGASLRAAADLARRNTTLALDLFGGRDRVGRAGDPGFAEFLLSGGARLTATQVIDTATVAELSWETTLLAGFQASPYRWVAIGGNGTCAGGARYCVPEHVPDRRLRHAVGLAGRRALTSRLSLGVDGRFYFDSWDVRSVTAQPELALTLGRGARLGLRYRYYTQGSAEFYRPRYVDLMTTGGHVARDRKLSAFYAHEAGLSYLREVDLGGDGALLVGVRSAVGRLYYLEFVGLDEVTVFEVTALLGVALR
jgi:hypothetical protein